MKQFCKYMQKQILNFVCRPTHRRQKFTLLHLFTDLFRKEIFITHWNKCKVNTLKNMLVLLLLWFYVYKAPR